MGGDKRFPWLILLGRQFLIKLIMPLKGRRMGEEEVGESAMERLALEKEGEGVGAVLSQPAGSRDSGMDWQTKEQDLCLSLLSLN